ncbi:MAG TPA: GntR family transcriptional regulator [Woeseiaceae bacterium]
MNRPSNLHARLASQVLDYVHRNRLPPGSHLPEPELCARFNVSRTPVRGALSLLEAQGYLERVPRRGYFTVGGGGAARGDDLPKAEEDRLYLQVAEDRVLKRLPPQNSEADLLRRYPVPRRVLIRVLERLLREGLAERRPGRGWMFSPVLDSKRVHDESYRFRLVIEPAALLEEGFSLDEAAAARSEEKHMRILSGAVRQVTPIELFEMNAEFHELLAASSGNRFFLEAIRQQNRLRRFVNYHWTYGAERVLETCREHMAVLCAARAGDLGWASSLLRRHLEVSSAVSPYPEGADSDASDVGGTPERVIQLA